MLKTRIITATVLLAVLLVVLFLLPPVVWRGTCALICALAAWEWGGLAGWGSKGRVAYGCVLGALCAMFVFLNVDEFKWLVSYLDLSVDEFKWLAADMVFVYLPVGAFWLLLVPFWLWRKWPLRDWSAVLTGIFVLLPPVSILMFLSPEIVLGSCAIVWVADIAAYFSGRFFGGKKLAPNISPGKTWAGAIGAVIGVLVYCNVVLFGLLKTPFPSEFGLIFLSQAGFIGLAVVSIVGDLFESLLKRQAGVKDSSYLLPGHGGILDRIDSLTSTMPCCLLLFFAVILIS